MYSLVPEKPLRLVYNPFCLAIRSLKIFCEFTTEDTEHTDYHMTLTREKIQNEILRIFSEEFEIENPGLDDNLREVHEFDSIDAIELLGEIETLLDSELTHDEKKQAMDIRTINQICDYVESMAQAHS